MSHLFVDKFEDELAAQTKLRRLILVFAELYPGNSAI